LIKVWLWGKDSEGDHLILSVAESGYEWQLCTHLKVSLSLGFKNGIKENSYSKSAMPKLELLLKNVFAGMLSGLCL
jgi:hypothetical protein